MGNEIELEIGVLIFAEDKKTENQKTFELGRDPNRAQPTYDAWGPFLEAPGNYRAR